MPVAVDPNDILNSPPASLVNPTVKVALGNALEPTDTDLVICEDPVYPVKSKLFLLFFKTLKVDLKLVPVLIVTLTGYAIPVSGSKVMVLLIAILLV